MTSSATTLPEKVFDYVVIGGGTSGLVVAARLTEDPNVRVLVLEAGENQLANPMINIPAMWTAILGSEMDYAFKTIPQDHLKGRILRHPQGKALGGSSALNAEIFVAPSKSEIDAWGKLGNQGWDWEALAPYYRKFHTFNLPSEANREHLGLEWSDEKARGVSGPIQTSFPIGPEDPLSKAWVDTFKGMGNGIKVDPLTGLAHGGYSNASTIDPATKTRSYSASAYYAPASGRPNLTVWTGATVKRLLLENSREGVVATGVSFLKDGEVKEVKASKEVILAAGAFQSPKLLELSGIGNSELLKSLGIEVIVENPNVGENLQDHAISAVSFEVTDSTTTADPLMRQEPAAVEYATGLYMGSQTGPLSCGSVASHALMPMTQVLTGKDAMSEIAALFENYASKNGTDPAFDFVREVTLSPEQASACILMFAAQVNAHDDKGEPGGKNYLQMPGEGNFITICSLLCHPLSRGSTHISSSDVNAPPTIDPKYLSHPLDIEVLSRHLLSVETLAKKQPLTAYLKPDGRRNHATATFKNDLNLAKDYAKTTVISNNHPSCTCPMLPKEKGGVVDDRLRVYGVANLRVVDSSVMPLIPRGNIVTSVYAVAERAADIIKEDAEN
ncbi:hypothetical protein BJ875DRAFT_481595 [Amylocarpus encephaloides]|uniref:Glucose-methanol-choline oxidoreductase N-terminal domain-containing protein n=1 Tax=Amylocarpus encephaloides TaxID=45428 RepID=A0A9P7YNN2_9HELO|nr:hypothetical protein BJ875DRAFT_481595 [Amylocarpus encephaloides]